jgi:hypothetical protein
VLLIDVLTARVLFRPRVIKLHTKKHFSGISGSACGSRSNSLFFLRRALTFVRVDRARSVGPVGCSVRCWWIR